MLGQFGMRALQVGATHRAAGAGNHNDRLKHAAEGAGVIASLTSPGLTHAANAQFSAIVQPAQFGQGHGH